MFSGQPPVMLSPGIHSFPFKLGLPPGLPSTFLGKSGWVQYYCKAALREPNSLTHKNQQVFIVMNPIDLNTEPSILSVVKHLYNMTFYYILCSTAVFISTLFFQSRFARYAGTISVWHRPQAVESHVSRVRYSRVSGVFGQRRLRTRRDNRNYSHGHQQQRSYH